MSPAEMTIIDPGVVKAEIVEYIGSVVEDARTLSIAIVDDEACEKAIALGAAVKNKIKWLKGRRVAVYKPLADATENVRLEYDTPLKLGEQIEKTLAAAVITYKQKKRAEEECRRLEVEAEARRLREEQARKEREAQAERERIIAERAREEQRKRDEAAAAERARVEAEAAKREAEAKAKAESAERARQLKEEEERRMASAQKAHDVGLAERSEQILEKQMPVAPIVPRLPSMADLQAQARADQARRDEEAARAREAEERRVAEEAKRAEEDNHLQRLDDEAALAKAEAAEAEAAANQSMTVARPEDRMRNQVTWRYDIPNVEAIRKLCLAIGEGRAPVEYIGFDPLEPQKFRAAAITKDVTRLKDQFQGEAIGVRTWPEESATFKADQVGSR